MEQENNGSRTTLTNNGRAKAKGQSYYNGRKTSNVKKETIKLKGRKQQGNEKTMDQEVNNEICK